MANEKPIGTPISTYAHCPPRRPVVFHVDEEAVKRISEEAKIIPLFEKGMMEHAFKNHYSMTRNANLRCAWNEYKKHIGTKVYMPFQFPNQRHLHFYNGTIHFKPSESEFMKPSFRKTMKPGPEVDAKNRLRPIPHELLMKRTTTVKALKGKSKKASKK